MTLPDWLTALLAERYPRPPAGVAVLTAMLRPAATAHNRLFNNGVLVFEWRILPTVGLLWGEE